MFSIEFRWPLIDLLWYVSIQWAKKKVNGPGGVNKFSLSETNSPLNGGGEYFTPSGLLTFFFWRLYASYILFDDLTSQKVWLRRSTKVDQMKFIPISRKKNISKITWDLFVVFKLMHIFFSFYDMKIRFI